MKKRVFFFNAIILTASSLVMRASSIGYRTYLSSKIGTAGMGLYQLVMSVFILAITAVSYTHLLFSCRFKFLAFPCSNGIFTATRTGHKQYYTLFCKVVCHEASPFGSSNTDGAMTLARTITSSCCQQPVSRSACSSL